MRTAKTLIAQADLAQADLSSLGAQVIMLVLS